MKIIIRLFIWLVLTSLFSGGVVLFILNKINIGTGTAGMGEALGYIIFSSIPSLIGFGILFWWVSFKYL